MKKNILSFLGIMAIAVFNVSAQPAVSYHQSGIPFFGVGYEIKNRLLPEIRVGTDIYTEDFSAEAVVTCQLLDTGDYELYAGIGGRVNSFEGVVVPAGINAYPFEHKNFGFHIEVAFIAREQPLLRGSWGIRYRFIKK